MPYLIAPSILSADFTHLGDDLHAVQNAGADWIHIDVMDGQYVPNLTMGPFIVEACRRAVPLPLDVHLMVHTPERILEAFAKAGATNITIHVETCPHLHRTLQSIRQLGCKTGVVLNPSTPVCLLEPVLGMVDLVLVMSVNPGYSGQTFLPEVLPKVAQLRRLLDQQNPQALLQIDGGINANTLPLALQAGANVFVVAQAIFGHPQGIQAGISALRQVIEQATKVHPAI
ncbi:MAG: ribulose-phosphate 3-epimerase [Anaerolineales bacterium]|nr:ribulose-phosphate 3-epimerase [Anaerolineales bacterium]